MIFTINSIDETISLGEQIGKLANAGDIICLEGDLGTGKTHLTKGIAKGLNIDDNITSPTFNIVNEYEGRLKFYHFDVYRVNDPDEIYAIGFDEYIFSDAVTVIEWSNYIEELIPEEHMKILIEKDSKDNFNSRKITITPFGERYNYIKEISL
ncbi:tRNA (adenosine(37)-N6)-threonylcarbamoyltransferase complex ATPase subunit type 1 TsaE [Clostridium cochlearium]|uniref:tRNA threonylcarbamoyladenosine biosynthesis protein TsaE n=1 Tax=Clostridium cochlearium TaxID=1494 RepID=A0A240AZ04_CLOCO|nr:tRNA (adenosine(37)-N6)-threonylcarbamoyltransferase complex ATPase subunit type 1 TsaE [Clostridium cochlearium]MBE6065194.1 tRNA (adenosine(37)-N6)-threonylcarbamoyltransferase complex ATPase subunit type 1 TsaE [Clostridium cochlearium]MBU5268569.1 tRNA (adenosine(37)-N6)-threonylcarbamoyltransferase complex ATPase subunit type 1 TsaE [Clostridium cochlearium]MCR1971016.1 tRNA (adenosine(37)-N6)-threonylcarbamoyltransferase complex ATPase subunit type 1 TsaE [Clostridium cochlearium]MDU14